MTIIDNTPSDARQQSTLRTLNRRIAYQLGKIAEHDKAVSKLYNEVNKAGFYQGADVHSIQEQDNQGKPRPYQMHPDKPQPLGLKGALLSRLGHGAAMPLGSDYEDPLTQAVRSKGRGPGTPLEKMIEWRTVARNLFYRNPSVKNVDVRDGLNGKQQMNNLFGIIQRVNELAIDRAGLPATRVSGTQTDKNGNPATWAIDKATLTKKGQVGFDALKQFNKYLNVLSKPGKYDVLGGAYEMGDAVADQVNTLYKRSAQQVLVPEEEAMGKLKPFFTRFKQFKTGQATLEMPVAGFWKKLLPTQYNLVPKPQEAIINPATGFTYAVKKTDEIDQLNPTAQKLPVKGPTKDSAFYGQNEAPVSGKRLSAREEALRFLEQYGIKSQKAKSKKGAQEIGLKDFNESVRNLRAATNIEPEKSVLYVTALVRRGVLALKFDNDKPYIEITNNLKSLQEYLAEMKLGVEKQGVKYRKNLILSGVASLTAVPKFIEESNINLKWPKTLPDGSLDFNDAYTVELIKKIDNFTSLI